MERSNSVCSSDVGLNPTEHRLFVSYHDICHERLLKQYDRIWCILDMVQKKAYPVTSLDIPQTKTLFDDFKKKFLLVKTASIQCRERDKEKEILSKSDLEAFIAHFITEWDWHKSMKIIHLEMIKILDRFVERLDDVFGYVFVNNLKTIMADLQIEHDKLLMAFEGYNKTLKRAQLGGE